MVHRFNIFLLSILLVLAQIFTMNQAMADNVGGWSMGNPVAQGASAVYTGTKNVIINGADYIKKGTAKITPTAAGVAKVLRGGVAGYALSIAVEQLLGSVDWVLDPANNQIRYKEKDSGGTSQPSDQYCYRGNTSGIQGITTCYSTLESAAQFECPIFWEGSTFTGNVRNNAYAECKKDGSTRNATINYIVNPAYDPNAQPQDKPEKTLPLDVVAQQVISNAQAGDTNAQVATMAAAADIVDEASKDEAKARPIAQQLESTAQTTPADQAAADQAGTATGESTANPETGATDLKLEFPIFCNWAPSVCEAAQVVISFPQTLTDWWNIGKNKAESWAQSISEAWTATKEWMNKEDIPEEETAVEIDQTAPVVPNTSYFNWGAYCPFAPGTQTISLENTSAGIDYDLSSWCQLATDVRPFVLAAGALMSYLIAAGVVMGRDD